MLTYKFFIHTKHTFTAMGSYIETKNKGCSYIC